MELSFVYEGRPLSRKQKKNNIGADIDFSFRFQKRAFYDFRILYKWPLGKR